MLVGGAASPPTACSRRWWPGLFTSPSDDYAGPGQGKVDVVVEPGQTGEDIATTLRDAGVVKSRSAYLDVAASNPKRAAAIQPGTYVLLTGMRAQQALDMLARPGQPRRQPRHRARGAVGERDLRGCRGRPASRSRSTKAAKDPEAIGLPA